jgi:Lrp/AsnC family leucine-responsive transcriptional regulator
MTDDIGGIGWKKLDTIDRTILLALQKDCRISLHKIARKLGVPKSTVHYRVRRLEEGGVIEGYYARLSPARLGNDYLAVVLVRAKYGPGYHKKVGHKLATIPGVWAVYYVLGDIDFVILIRAVDRADYMRKLELISSMKDIERTSTQVVADIVKEEPRVEIAP